MAIGVASDLVIYNEEFFAGMYEKVAQMTDAFNAASRNTMQMIRRDTLGEYAKESFFQKKSLVSRRDRTSTSDATAIALTQEELISVKLYRKIGPVEQALGSFKDIGMSMEEASFMIGQSFGEQKVEDMLNTTISALVAAVGNVSDLVYDATDESGTTITHTYLANTMAKFGDRAQQILCWVMHSNTYYDLVGQAISDNVFEVASGIIYGGTAPTFGRPVLVTDSSSLYSSDSTPDYYVLGLVEGAAKATESEEPSMLSETVGGKEQLVLRVQSEFAYNLECKGFQWDTSNGGSNPTSASVATGSNWDQVVTSVKDCAGVMLTVT